jgi:hypothetical protein
MKSSAKSMLQHLWIFVLIEIIFVLIIFRELPETSLYTLIGVLHLSYWAIIIGAWWLRERATHIWQKFCCTYLPIVYHLVIHLYAWRSAIEIHAEEHHDEHSIVWMIISAWLLGGLIWAGEWYLHRVVHCQTHHASAHAHCQDDCEHEHNKY